MAHSSNAVVASRNWRVWLAGLIIVIAGMAAYGNSLEAPFVYDEPSLLADEESEPQSQQMTLDTPENGPTTYSHLLVNLSLLLNYSVSGHDVTGYHVLNLTVHLLAGLVLFGLVRHTLERPALFATYGKYALLLAFAVALLWTLHPLHTASVTRVSRRGGALAGLFYLLTLYCFARSLEGHREKPWQAMSILACLFGMATKEVMLTAPLMVLLYDRTFGAGTFRAAWRRRPGFYTALASNWLVLLVLLIGANPQDGRTNFYPGIAWWSYALKQCVALTHYLRLAFWPNPLVLDYGWSPLVRPLEIWPQAIFMGALLTATGYALVRRPVIGFLGAWFFVILVPSSSVVPLTLQTMAERRTYLPLIAVLVALVLGLFRLLGRRSLAAVIMLAVALGILTQDRNEDYALATQALARNVSAYPLNTRARENLAAKLARVGRLPESVQIFESALLMDTTDAQSYNNLGNALHLLGQTDAAVARYRRAIELKPDLVEAHNNLGLLLCEIGQTQAAIPEFQAILRYRPNSGSARLNLANAYNFSGRPQEGRPIYEEVLQRNPDWPEAHYGLGNSLLLLHQLEAAAKAYATAVRLRPDYAPAHTSLGNALLLLHRPAEAAACYQIALRLNPQSEIARTGLEKARSLRTSPSSVSAGTPTGMPDLPKAGRPANN